MEQKRRPFPAQLFSAFGKRELQDILEIVHYAGQAKTDEDVSHVLHLFKRLLPCPNIIGGIVRISSGGRIQEFAHVLNVSYPNDWLYRYGTNGYAEVDPVLLSLLKTARTQVWTQTYRQVSSKKQKEFIEEARSFGLEGGITSGTMEEKRAMASFFSFAGSHTSEKERYTGIIAYVTPLLHQAMVSHVQVPDHDYALNLTPRELTVLTWMKSGKTNWEISRILGVSERTVRFHVESIFMKLDVSSRTQAVAYAMETGMFKAS